jgi:uncharacterized protein
MVGSNGIGRGSFAGGIGPAARARKSRVAAPHPASGAGVYGRPARRRPMSHTPHELHEEFPHAVEKVHALKVSNHHFARIADQYHDVNREIHRIETNVTPASDETLEDLKKQRLHLKDEIAAMLAA